MTLTAIEDEGGLFPLQPGDFVTLKVDQGEFAGESFELELVEPFNERGKAVAVVVRRIPSA